VYKGVAKDVEIVFLKTVSALIKVSNLPKNVYIEIVPAPSVAVGDGLSGLGFGVFVDSEDYSTIAIAGKYCNEMKQEGLSRKEWLCTLPEIIVHEWAHMEQWRDGKKLNHKGITKRTKELLKVIS